MYVQRITRNPVYFDSIKPSLDKFFSDVLLPCLLRGRVLIIIVLLLQVPHKLLQANVQTNGGTCNMEKTRIAVGVMVKSQGR